MWDLPGPGLKPVSPALAGGCLTTAPPGKPPCEVFLHNKNICPDCGRDYMSSRMGNWGLCIVEPQEMQVSSLLNLWRPEKNYKKQPQPRNSPRLQLPLPCTQNDCFSSSFNSFLLSRRREGEVEKEKRNQVSLCPPPAKFACFCGQPDTTGETKTPPGVPWVPPWDTLFPGCLGGTGLRNLAIYLVAPQAQRG